MANRPNNRFWAKLLVLMGASLLLLTTARTGSAGLQLSVDGKGMSFALTSASMNLSFDIGHACPISNTCRLLTQ